MKLSKLTVSMLAAASLVLGSCSDDSFDGGKYASLNFSLKADNSLSVGSITRADGEATITMAEALGVESFTQPEAGNFTIKITHPEEGEKYNGLLSAYSSETVKLPISAESYTVEANYGAENSVGFYGTEPATGAPKYYGEKTFTITNAETKNEEINVALANSILKFVYTSSAADEAATVAEGESEVNLFKNYFSDCDITVTDQANNVVAYNDFEARGAFLEAGRQTIAYTLTVAQAQDDASKTITGTVTVEVVENTCHIFKFNVTNVGGVNKLEIEIDDTIATTHDITVPDIDINDDNYIVNNGGENA